MRAYTVSLQNITSIEKEKKTELTHAQPSSDAMNGVYATRCEGMRARCQFSVLEKVSWLSTFERYLSPVKVYFHCCCRCCCVSSRLLFFLSISVLSFLSLHSLHYTLYSLFGVLHRSFSVYSSFFRCFLAVVLCSWLCYYYHCCRCCCCCC